MFICKVESWAPGIGKSWSVNVFEFTVYTAERSVALCSVSFSSLHCLIVWSICIADRLWYVFLFLFPSILLTPNATEHLNMLRTSVLLVHFLFFSWFVSGMWHFSNTSWATHKLSSESWKQKQNPWQWRHVGFYQAAVMEKDSKSHNIHILMEKVRLKMLIQKSRSFVRLLLEVKTG